MSLFADLTALLGLPRFEKTDESVASTLDLREEPSECKRPAVRKVLSGIFKAPVWVRDGVNPCLCVHSSFAGWRAQVA